MIVDLANLDDRDCDKFWQRWHPSPPEEGKGELKLPPSRPLSWLPREQVTDLELLKIRDQLRAVWDLAANSNLIVQEWFEWNGEYEFQGNKFKLLKFLPMPQIGYVMPNPTNLRIQLAWGVCELGPKLGHCQAEACPAPYFLRYRDERQQFCERPGCQEFGQRLHKREWAKKAREEQKLRAAKKTPKKK